jgi:phosphoadenosine phosphosulfate reductase
MNKVKEIEKLIEGKSAEEILKSISSLNSEQITFSTSLGFEDQVIMHLIFTNNFPINVFTLDTGRLFPETYSVLSSTLGKYKKPIEVFYPQTSAVEKLLSEKGPFSFYNSPEARKECCHIRKVEPLQRALKGKSIWITGIRAEQSANRNSMKMVEWDDAYQLIKIHPLLNWSFEETKQFISQNNIPYNSLHDKGFVSIGCQPCTRAVKESEDFRAGRWWWEASDKKECGLHFKS